MATGLVKGTDAYNSAASPWAAYTAAPAPAAAPVAAPAASPFAAPAPATAAAPAYSPAPQPLSQMIAPTPAPAASPAPATAPAFSEAQSSSILRSLGMPVGANGTDWLNQNPDKIAAYNQQRAAAGDSWKFPVPTLDQAIDAQIQATTADPTYGSLAKPPLPPFVPFTGADLPNDPGYKFRVDQGNKAINAAQAARGGLYSGAALKEIDKYNSDQGSQEFNNANTRYVQNFNTSYGQASGDQNSLYNRLAGLSNTATNGVNTSVQNNQNNAANLGTIYSQGANASAASSLNTGNDINTLLSKILSQNSIGNSSYGGKTTPYFGG